MIEDKLDKVIELLESIDTKLTELGEVTPGDHVVEPDEETPTPVENEEEDLLGGDDGEADTEADTVNPFEGKTVKDAVAMTKEAMEVHKVDTKIIGKLLKTYGSKKASLIPADQVADYMKELNDIIEDIS